MSNRIEDVVDKIVKGEVELHKIDEILDANAAMVARRLAIERLTGNGLPSIGSTIIDYYDIKNKNAENVIGATQIPLGVAGPILIDGDYAKGNFFVPLATTEGALIASVNRGMKVLRKAGPVRTKIVRDGMTRAPVFVLDSVVGAMKFIEWVNQNFEAIRNVTESTSKHGKLKKIEPLLLGNNVWLRFEFETGDAMGMNMVTIATEAACSYIEQNFEGARCVAVSGNACSDKKQSMVNELWGRGKTVVAETIISSEILKKELRTTAEKILDVNLRKNWLGGARAGTIFQYNAHFANIIAAIFIATGQDVAQVVESSTGFTWVENRGDNLYISVTLPSLEVGTVGGGTRLPTQREALSIMGVQGSGNPPGSNAKKFAEIIAAAVLAGELNLLSALSTRELGKAHKMLGRGIKT
ncbi:hydroxymethylglutaryl-CoA reductase (NADPH) [Metallosphaera tengchongensis]|uniref:3-hydroxy-3-methylglutaryl coenzyme A reductase n=1 Tax=Metallosphaera tengchongensis TaxID=1532350 RepID=A0A6N0NR06_9CREN|nr:hydroxymethylglutaryl-CoA reductase (NADPH) [Metallosphaera tengchongensis]QKQ99303.1 hydroxymethylglutaryl-CoA reductase (NADPH) [Metallosphaera tengchongensis]